MIDQRGTVYEKELKLDLGSSRKVFPLRPNVLDEERSDNIDTERKREKFAKRFRGNI